MARDFSEKKIYWKWVGISIIIFLIAQTLLGVVFSIFGILTFGLGFILFSWLLKPVIYFVTGFLTGLFSPGITIIEPALGALIVSVLGVIFFAARYRGNLFMIILSGVIAFIIALVGAYIGEQTSAKRGGTV